MKIQAFQVIQEDFQAQYKDDPDALRDVEKRKEYGKDMCTEEEWGFLYGQVDNEASTIIIWLIIHSHEKQGIPSDMYQGPLIIKTFAIHFNLTTPKEKIKGFEVGNPKAGISLAIMAVGGLLFL